ncbi:tropomyosin-1, isoforms 33/34-like isoform X2 [Ornithodoros turicata]|uniref:tropomyosin-1, isoforms 33/34-like isoform X2 n=1 Tax=Ornithodoros turicata TaxID=34597 RepID=UPI00313900DC
MTAGVTMRSSKGRTVLYVLVGCSIAFLVYILSSTHNKLKFTEESNDKCQQQRDSLSAQLQVLYEHKSRLEKSLQNEMAEKKKVESEMRTFRETVDREKAEAVGRYSELQQKYDEVKKNNLEDFNNLKGSYATLVGDKEKLEADMGKYVKALEQQKSNEANLHEHIKELSSSLRTAEAALEQERNKYSVAQSQLDTCQSIRLQLAAQLAQSNVAIKSNAEAPVVMKSVMKEQRDLRPLPNAVPSALPDGVPNAIHIPSRQNIILEKTPVAPKLSQEEVKDEKLAGGAMGLHEKEQQKLQAPVPPEDNAGVLQLPLSANKLAGGGTKGKSLSSAAHPLKLEQAPVAAEPPSAGAVIFNRSASTRNALDNNPPRYQAVPPQDGNGVAPNYQAAPPHDQAPPPPPPPGEQQQAAPHDFIHVQDAEKPESVPQDAQGKENQQEGAIQAPQAADLVQKEDGGDNVLVPPKSGEAGDGGEAGPAEVGRARPEVGEGAQKMGNLARPLIEAPQQGAGRRGPVYPHGEEDNREYAEPVREDDAGDDQDADGAIFGADHRKQFQDADFDDQMVEPENQQAVNQMHGEGLMVNPK